jgi:DNA-binding transcriptional ArsR family regulator
LKDRLYEELGCIAKGIDSPRRLELIDLLAQGERSVEDLASEATSSIANTSRISTSSGRLVATREEGYYRLAHAEVYDVARTWARERVSPKVLTGRQL